jgi:UrcA family protein
MFTTTNDFARTAVATLGTLFFAGVCLVAAAAPAAAAPAAPVAHTTTVAYGDLNLANASGRSTLEQRITYAARSVCFNGGHDVASKLTYDRCVKAAKADAKAQVMPVTAGVTAN